MNMLQQLRDAPDDAAFQVGDQVISKTDALKMLIEQREGAISGIVSQRDEWVRYRKSTGVEDRWTRAKELYDGEEMPDSTFVETLKTGPQARGPVAQANANRSKVAINIVQPKTDQAIARMCEIVLPVDDRNWGIKPTPVPEAVSKMIGDHRETVRGDTGAGTGQTADQEAQKWLQRSRAAADAMQDVIDDQLTECHYNAEQRDVITDGVKLGTGIMLGPFPAKQTSKTWAPGQDGKHALQFNSKTVPASVHADPWDVWFDPACGNNHQNGAGFWHKRQVTRKQIRALQGVLGFDDDELQKVLAQNPSRISVTEGRVRRTWAIKEEAYELWTYHGDIEPDVMSMASMNTKDQLDVDFGVVMLINDHVVGAMPSWIADRSLPVDVWCWRKSDDSPYGYGLPNSLEHQQRVVTSAWRQVMDNARWCVGGQIVYMKGVRPVDGNYTIYPGKTWEVDPVKIDDVLKAFNSVEFAGHVDELLKILDKAMEFADSEVSMPQLMGGEQGSAPETVGGTVLLYNNAQAVLRLRVKFYDDDMTSPHIGRYYDWNMANNEDPNIKGDSEVDARGSTTLLEKDIQNQATMNLAQVTANPRYAAYLDPKKELMVLLKAFKQMPESLMADDEQIKRNLEQAAKAQPQDPRIEAANIAAEVKREDIAARLKEVAANAATQRELNQQHAQDREYNKQREQAEYEIAMTAEQNDRDLQEQRLASEQNIKAAELEANTGIKHLEIDTKRQIFNAEAELRVQTGQGI